MRAKEIARSSTCVSCKPVNVRVYLYVLPFIAVVIVAVVIVQELKK